MKKLFFLLLLIPFFASAQKTTPGNYTYIAQKYEWDAGIYKGLGLPSGSGPAAFITGQVQRAGAVYFDTLGVDAGFYIYNGTAWVLQGTPSAVDLDDELLSGGSVTPQGTGFKLSVQEAVYRISGVIYGSDSGSVTLSGSDPSLNRIDYIYLGTDNTFHVLEGVPGLPAAEPRLENDQLGIAFVSIPAGSTTPGVSTVVVYNENTESTVSNTGTTTDPDNTTNVFTGAKSLNVTNIAANDMIHFTAPITFNASGFDALAIHMLPKAVLGSGNRLYVQLFVGSTAVSNEVEIVWNRNNITTYQAISISAQALGTLTNYNVTRVRIRYVGSGANFAGFYFDYIFFQTGTSQPNPPGGGGFPNIIPPATWGVSGNGTQNITITTGGQRSQLMRGDGSKEWDSTAKYVGDVNSLAKSPNGANINPLTNEFVGQDADIDDRGFMTAELWRVVDTLRQQTIENGDNTLDTLVYAIDAWRTAVKSIKDSTGIGIVDRGNYLAFYSTGGGSGGRFGVSGEDDTGAENRAFTFNSLTNNFIIEGNDGTISNYINYQDPSNFKIGSNGPLGDGFINFSGGYISLNNLLDAGAITTLKNVVIDTAGNLLYTKIDGGGGGSGTVTNVATGYGVSGGPITTTGTIVADTTSADGLVSKDYLTDRIAEIETPNLIVDSLGTAGVDVLVPRNDSLYHRLILGETFLIADTLADGSISVRIDTASSLFKLYIQANSTGSAGVLWSRLSSDHTLSDVNTDQTLLPSAQDVFPVQANTLYLVEAVLQFSTGTASHSKGIGFTLSGGATTANNGIESQSWGTVAGTASTASTNIFLTGLTSVTATALTTAGGATMTFKGLIQVTNAGNVTPIVRFTSAPGGTNLLKTDSYIKMTPIGADTFTTAGGVN